MKKKYPSLFVPRCIFLVGIACILVLPYLYFTKRVESFEARIPLDIYQTWKTKALSPKLQESMDQLKRDNPEFTHHLYDDADCREFIEANFPQDVVEAYDTLIPGAYKADLWRYCILYKRGGIYIDHKYHTANGFHLIALTDKDYLVRDISESGGGIYNAFMVMAPNHPTLLECIHAVVENVKNNYYGNTPLDPTGPLLMKRFFFEDADFDGITLGEDASGNTSLIYQEKPILTMYAEYRKERPAWYGTLWKSRKIYKNN